MHPFGGFCFWGGSHMGEVQARRKLAAILSADVKGYSRLMEDDEEATVQTIKAYRELIVNQIQNQNGRVVDAKGDNLLAEFSSVVDAVRGAVEIQKELLRQNTQLPANRRMEFRVGVNLGDVIQEEETIYGDGVNIAARLEAIADGGGICISGTIYDQVENKLGLEYDYLGERVFKNLRKPVRVYRVRTENVVSGIEMGQRLPLPDKPSIAILPFVNMSGDLEQEYFSDGISEDIITALSQIPDMFVIARNSSFTYKGKPVNVRQVGWELGVRFVLEGSVRKVGNRVRITAQLNDATTGHHLWAERYDREMEDIFSIQDEITMKIITALQVKLTVGEQARLYTKGTQSIEAYMKMWQATSHFFQGDKGSNFLAREICEEVISVEPNWEVPYCILGWTHWQDVWLRWSDSPEESVQKAFQFAQKAISLNESPIAHALLGFVYTLTKQHEKAIKESERSIALSPNSADALAWYGHNLIYFGDYEQAISLLEKALRLNPFPPGWYFRFLAMTYRLLGRYDEAISAYKKAIYKEPSHVFSHIGLAVTYAVAGHETDARDEGLEVLRIDPDFSLEHFAKILPFKDQTENSRIIEALRKAGLK